MEVEVQSGDEREVENESEIGARIRESYTYKVQKHEPISFCLNVVHSSDFEEERVDA